MPIQNVSMVARPLEIIRTNPEQTARSAADRVGQACGDLLSSGTDSNPTEYQHNGSNRRERSNGSLLERMAVGIGRGTGLLSRVAGAPSPGDEEPSADSVLRPVPQAPRQPGQGENVDVGGQ